MHEDRTKPGYKIEFGEDRHRVFADLIQVGQSTIVEDTYILQWPDGESRTFKRRFLVALIDKVRQP